jgi:hypothetical protein
MVLKRDTFVTWKGCKQMTWSKRSKKQGKPGRKEEETAAEWQQGRLRFDRCLKGRINTLIRTVCQCLQAWWENPS